MNKTIKKIWNWISGLLVAVVVLLAVALVGVRLIGLQPFVVLSGSMEPEYHVGSLIYVKSVDYKELQVGDDITYLIDEDTVVTHRIIEVLVDENDPDTIRYFKKESVFIKVKASIPSEDTVDLHFTKFPEEEHQLLVDMIQVLGNSNLGICRVLVE